MRKRTLMTVVVGLILAMVASTGLADALTDAADKLVTDQQVDGSWPTPDVTYDGYAGESIIGLCHAYELTNDSDYRTKAQAAGQYELNNISGGLVPSVAYAMARLSAIDDNPGGNDYRTALVADLDSFGGNVGATITWYQDVSGIDDSTIVYDVARMAVAAEYVNHADKLDWRNGVITLLGDVDDTDVSPVMALGAAVWALASTGDISTDTTEVWTGVDVNQLPGMLVGRQVTDEDDVAGGEVIIGSFFTELDTDTYPSYTEPTVMGTLGLQAADASLYSTEIALAVGVLEAGIDPNGDVFWVIDDAWAEVLSGEGGLTAGETLEAIPEPATMSLLLVGAVGMIRRRRSK